MTISAKIIADSILKPDYDNNPVSRITTMIVTFPRFILAEFNTHRMFSRNSASSRAIPFEKMLEVVQNNPFIPITWQKDHKGMQGTEYFTDHTIDENEYIWLVARDEAVFNAKCLHDQGVTKQLCNRLLEPFMWHTVIVTATEWENFFKLRCPQYHTPVSGEGFYFRSKKDCIANHSNPENISKLENMTDLEWLQINTSQAEIHIQAIAEAMWDAMNESIPNQLKAGEWHIPFGDKIDYALHKWNFLPNIYELWGKDISEYGIKVSTARCARLSYMTFDGEIDYEKDIALHDTLLSSRHMSPFEHCARAMTNEEYVSFVKGNLDTIEIDEPNDGEFVAYNKVWNHDKEAGWCNNFRGFIQYRYLLENEK